MSKCGKIEVHQVLKSYYILNFELACMLEIKKRVKDLYRDDLKTWSDFERRLKDEFYNKDFARVIKRSFLKWFEEQKRKSMAKNEFLMKFEKKFSQILSLRRFLLDVRKIKLFLQVVHEVLKDMFFVLLANKSTKEDLAND